MNPQKSYLLAIRWAILILVMSLIPGSSLPNFDWSDLVGIDKIGHAGVYLILTFLICLRKLIIPRWKKLMVAVGLSSIFGIVMEVLQLTIYTGRNFEFLDIIANIIGSFLGAFLYNLFTNKFLWKD